MEGIASRRGEERKEMVSEGWMELHIPGDLRMERELVTWRSAASRAVCWWGKGKLFNILQLAPTERRHRH